MNFLHTQKYVTENATHQKKKKKENYHEGKLCRKTNNFITQQTQQGGDRVENK